MKILCVIPHFYRPKAGHTAGGNNSNDISRKAERIAVLGETISAFHQLYGNRVAGLDHWRKVAWQAASPHSCEVDVVVCTLGDDHLLDALEISPVLYRRVKINDGFSPSQLGFTAHMVMREFAGRYDWYCYVEDDVVMTDPLFFRKRALFDAEFGPEALLQPNRFENNSPFGYKVYPDYILGSPWTKPFQDLSDRPDLTLEFLGEPVRFERTSYPSAGSFFLNAAQLERWLSHPAFLDMDESFLGPLDSAGILSVMKTFRVYKPVLDHAPFLEVKHGSPRWAPTVGLEDRPVIARTQPFADLPDHAHEDEDRQPDDAAVAPN
ncbi:hypothetical protein [Azospirillum sp. TSO35-2]|uniref:hypothetical protein n=1 Tax=Azospirillum sp. TSO35-2 TaxID=716796 RepID=UPI0011B69F10|nr:hypothetical protein [Azospirillum sp. TSO35-2]